MKSFMFCAVMLASIGLFADSATSSADSPAVEPALSEPATPQNCSARQYHQFDFWLGRWTAYSADGKKQGTNHLHRVIGNCGLQENWVGANGQYKGTSYNVYVASKNIWHQTWVDNQGGTLFLEGTLTDGKMRLSGVRKNQKGADVIDRITWTPLADGRVRQHWQSSEDQGATWSDVFDGYYVRDES